MDARFSVDDANPTIHAGTGYPMCIPRTDPTAQDDPLCPQQNRPNRVSVTVGGATVTATTCRNFSQAGVAPPAGSGELTPPAAGQKYCSQYVMAAPPADATTAMPLNGSHVQPDARQQAPFEVGDFITYSGTLMQDAAGDDFVSAHTIEANLGIYTQPGTQPSYVAIGEFGVGSADPAATAVERGRPGVAGPDLPGGRDDRLQDAGRHLLRGRQPRRRNDGRTAGSPRPR